MILSLKKFKFKENAANINRILCAWTQNYG